MTISWQDILTFLGGLAFLAAALSVVWYQWRKNKTQAAMVAADQWEKVAGGYKAEAEQLKGERDELSAALETKTREHAEAEKRHNECTQEVLRMVARLRKHERVINDLERRAGLPMTDFDNPTHHNDSETVRNSPRGHFEGDE